MELLDRTGAAPRQQALVHPGQSACGSCHKTIIDRTAHFYRKESAVKPGSVVDSHSSGIRVAAHLKRPTRKPMWATCGNESLRVRHRASLFGLAPGGVCHAVDVATRAVRSYRTISPLPAPLARHLGGIFLLHFPWARAPQALPGTFARWSPDFPPCALKHTATAWPTLGAHLTRVDPSGTALSCRPRCRARRRSAPPAVPPASAAIP